MAFTLSERQQATVATAVTIVSACVILAALALLFWLIGLFFAAFSNVFLPLAVAAVAALVLRPYYQLLIERLRFPRVLALVGVFASLLLPLVAFGGIFGALIVDQITDLAATVPERWERLSNFVQERYPRLREFADRHGLKEQLQGAVESQASTLVQGLQSVAGGALTVGRGFLRGVGAVFTWAVLPVYFAFFLMIGPGRFDDHAHHLPFLKPETRRNVLYLAQEFVDILVAFFRGQLIIALLQGVLFAVGFSIVGLRYGLILGLMLGLLNIIPYLGSIVGLALGLPIAFFQDGGGWWMVLWVLIVFTAVQLIEGYLLTPKIMGDRTGLHPMAIIVAVFFWGSALGGISGMILAIPLTAFLVVFWRLAREHYIGELV